MSRGMTRAERLQEMERIYTQHQGGLTDIEMAERLGVDRTTVYRDRIELTTHMPVVEAEGEPGRFKIDRMRYLSSIRVNLAEALALYLAARRMSRHTRTNQPHVVSALEKLAVALKQPMTERLVRAASAVAQQNPDPVRVAVMETLARGWAERIKVRITHTALSSKRAMSYTISPYLIEPSLWSDGAYVIGHSDVHNDLATFKIERIEHASLTTERFTIPEDFDEQELLRFAWGIWYSDKEPVTVKLKFTGREAVTRLKESIWHPQQRPLVDTGDGGCIWAAPVAEWQEMLPWIRGWGADCEVMEPKELREKLKREVQHMATLYQVGNKPTPPLYQLLWAKTDDAKTRTHPLICHMIDVAQVTLALWKYVLTDSIRCHISTSLGLENEIAGRVVAFWAGLHDLGKASPAFQRQYKPSELMLAKTGLPFDLKVGEKGCHHGAITTQVLTNLMKSETSLPSDWANRVAVAVGGHHGDWPTSQDLEDFAAPSQIGGPAWEQVRRELVQRLKEMLLVPNLTLPVLSTETTNAFFILLSGVTSVADWLGSMEAYFKPATEDVNVIEYVHHAEQKAVEALKETGWLGWQPPKDPVSFSTLCNITKLRPLQEKVVTLASQLDRPALVIIEAPTGVGKTEAALYLADHWAYALDQRGMYVAMPTMATSNQMFRRVKEVLERRYPAELVNYQLMHGNALLMDQVPRLARVDREDTQNIVAALEWFTKRKRGLLAPFGVGTVDQALTSILQTRHFFVRLFGLSHKTIIFDEVHIYDTYMDELFYLLLGWLRILDTSVVILSATLSNASRRNILEAYTGHDMTDMPNVPYPAVTWTTGDNSQVIPLEGHIEQTVAIEKIERDPTMIAHHLKRELHEGGCAAVICNTVGRAQEIYRAVRDAKIVPEDNLILFHARFPFAWRADIEEDVLDKFGPNKEDKTKPNPRRLYKDKTIVIATQVIEQSLDLDFDLMVSDLAPIDMVIQRVGRLHRHDVNDDHRSTHLHTPRLLLAMPEIKNDVPAFDRGDVRVYGRYWLLRSWAVLRECPSITTPKETQQLVESVYGAEDLMPPHLPEAFHQAVGEAKEKMDGDNRKAKSQARGKLIADPDEESLLEESNAGLEEDNPALHRYRQAATRLAQPTVTLVCLYKMPHGLALDPKLEGITVDLAQEPDRELTRQLLNRKVDVTHYDVVKYFVDQSPPSGWRENPWLRYARVVDFTERGEYQPEGETWKLKLDRKLGLIIEEEKNV